MKLDWVLLVLASTACAGAPPKPCKVEQAASTPTDPRKQTWRQRIEGQWSMDKWFVDDQYTLPPEIGGIFTLADGVATFQLNVRPSKAWVYCIGYYNFTENDTVFTIGWNRCSRWKIREGGVIEGDWEDQWDGIVPVFKIKELPNGDLSLKYNTQNEHPHEVKHGVYGWDMTFHPDETLEYWNMQAVNGRKDNVKFFTKLHHGDPKIPF